MFILKKEHQPGVYVPLMALFLVLYLTHYGCKVKVLIFITKSIQQHFNLLLQLRKFVPISLHYCDVLCMHIQKVHGKVIEVSSNL